MSIISSCIPNLRPLLEAFPSGMMVNNDVKRHRISSRYASNYSKQLDHDYVLRDMSTTLKMEPHIHATQELHDSENSSLPDLTGRGQAFQNTFQIAIAPEEIPAGDSPLHHSSQQSENRIIRATTTIETVWHNRAGAKNHYGSL